jgi:hypothetical protein
MTVRKDENVIISLSLCVCVCVCAWVCAWVYACVRACVVLSLFAYFVGP